ncbi:MAG: hypothetical protein Q9183_001438 [Haloplaca sp. 2 TL-2023]
MTRKDKSFTNFDSFLDPNFDEDIDFFNNTGTMAGTGQSSPFIKDEPEDSGFSPYNLPINQRRYNMPVGQNFGGNAAGSIDPSELTMQNSNFGQYNMGSQQQMPNNYYPGNSFVNDDELLDFDLNDTSGNHGQIQATQQGFGQQYGNMNMPSSFHQMQSNMGGQGPLNQQYSQTPESAPAHSPFIQNYARRQLQQNHSSPQARPVQGASVDSNYMMAGHPNVSQAMDRQLSSSRSPMTPKTPGVGGLNLGTPESGSLPSQPIPSNFNQHRHRKSLSTPWDSNSGSLLSYGDSPMSSPGNMVNHAQISEIMKRGASHSSSLPAKVDNHAVPTGHQSQEAKRRRRRESHNMVERRRRDNINERIQELSHLVPQHRLDDEKVRKHIVNNTPLSPSLVAVGRSPPQATSLLAGGGRRATTAGNISLGLPLDEKNTGPNKGDILNGAVSWTRDLMWALHIKMQQESELAEIIASLGGKWPFEPTEDEKRMRTELLNAMADNNPSSFSYTRYPGSGLRVPNHTNHMGEPLNVNQMDHLSPQSLSPGVQSGGSGANSGGIGQPQYWTHDGRGFKEEDEYGMEMN